jgi:hypothetical protein
MPCPPALMMGEKIGGIGEWIMLRGKIPVDRIQGLCEGVQPGEIRSGCLGRAREGSRHALHGHHRETPRRFRPVPQRGQRMGHRRCHSVEKGPDRPLAEATRAEGLKFGLYYSQAQDWTTPAAPSPARRGKGWDEAQQGRLRPIPRQGRRATGARNPHPLPARHPLVGHADLDEPRTRRTRSSSRSAPASSTTTASAAATRATPKPPSSTSPPPATRTATGKPA